MSDRAEELPAPEPEPHTSTVNRPDQPLSTADLASASNRPQPVAEATPHSNVTPMPTRPDSAMPHSSTEARSERTPLFTEEQARGFRSRWDGIQTGFVDEPRHAVEQADELVAEAIKRLAEMFANERSKLESQWDRGDNISTEDLRLALQRYRSFFDRLLSF